MRVRISQPAKTAMQSGRAAEPWLLEYELETPRRPEPLMGWVSSGDTLNQVALRFPTREAAIAFALAKGFEYDVIEAQPRQVRPRSYADNFRWKRPQDQS